MEKVLKKITNIRRDQRRLNASRSTCLCFVALQIDSLTRFDGIYLHTYYYSPIEPYKHISLRPLYTLLNFI